ACQLLVCDQINRTVSLPAPSRIPIRVREFPMRLVHSIFAAGALLRSVVAVAALTPFGEPVPINSKTDGHQDGQSVASTGAGGCVVIWQTVPAAVAPFASARRYDSLGHALGDEVVVRSFVENGPQAVVSAGDGTFTVVFNDGTEIVAQTFDHASGLPLNDE